MPMQAMIRKKNMVEEDRKVLERCTGGIDAVMRNVLLMSKLTSQDAKGFKSRMKSMECKSVFVISLPGELP